MCSNSVSKFSTFSSAFDLGVALRFVEGETGSPLALRLLPLGVPLPFAGDASVVLEEADPLASSIALMTRLSAFPVTVLNEATWASGLNCREATSQLTFIARHS
jgi:hypothetical protein